MGCGCTILGLDISVTSTGIVVLSGNGDILLNTSVGEGLKKPTTWDEQKRVNMIVNRVEEVIGSEYDIKYVVIEGFAFNQWGQSASAHKIIELTGAIKAILFQWHFDPIIIPASKARKIVLGHNITTSKAEKALGFSTKTKIVSELKDNFDLSFPTDDEADAFILAEALSRTIGLSGEVTQDVRTALNPSLKRKKRKKRTKNDK